MIFHCLTLGISFFSVGFSMPVLVEMPHLAYSSPVNSQCEQHEINMAETPTPATPTPATAAAEEATIATATAARLTTPTHSWQGNRCYGPWQPPAHLPTMSLLTNFHRSGPIRSLQSGEHNPQMIH